MLWQNLEPQELAVGHGCSCPEQCISAENCPEVQNFPVSPLPLCLQCSFPAWRGYVHHVPFILLSSLASGFSHRIHIPGFHISAPLKTSQAEGTQSLGRIRTLSSHLPGSWNLYKFSSSVGCRLNIKPLKHPLSEKTSIKAGQELTGVYPCVYKETQIQPWQAGSGHLRDRPR